MRVRNLSSMSSSDDGIYGPTEVYLQNGVSMPILGLGTSHSGGYSHSTVVYALQECGYRLIDTAKRYGCEEFLQQAVQDAGVEREEIFLSTKLWPTDYGCMTTRKALRGSLKRLGVDYLDLYLMHWPECHSSCPDKRRTLEETWRELELIYEEGLCRAIGVSNYEIKDLEKLLDMCTIVPHVNQVEFHPFYNPISLRKFCDEHKVQFQGYCPLGKGNLLKIPQVVKIAEKCQRTSAQVLIRWSIQNNVVTIPKSTKKHRVNENAEVFDFEIQPEDMEILNSLHRGKRYVERSGIQAKIDSPLPDGYKLGLVPTSNDIPVIKNYS